MTNEINPNDVLAFLIEIVALALLGTWAWRTAPEPVIARLGAVVLVLAVALTLWGLFAAPKATFQVPAAAIAVKVLVLGGSVLAAYPMWPLVLVVLLGGGRRGQHSADLRGAVRPLEPVALVTSNGDLSRALARDKSPFGGQVVVRATSVGARSAGMTSRSLSPWRSCHSCRS
ncbi:YrdB family protein [Flexivirga meconopsidis]|uniref:YrdB family protein n=1 Tax=Flexivirga meconopsidis TaxID=2977121 RepID=UPI00223EA171|nr:YrdB family protein [Flexivirga meconopsidis]